MWINVFGLGKGMLQVYISYMFEGKGGNILFLFIFYVCGCKVIFEDELGVNLIFKYYYINFCKYFEGIQVEIFFKEVVERVVQKIVEVDNCFFQLVVGCKGEIFWEEKSIFFFDLLVIFLFVGENVVYEVKFNICIDNFE